MVNCETQVDYHDGKFCWALNGHEGIANEIDGVYEAIRGIVPSNVMVAYHYSDAAGEAIKEAQKKARTLGGMAER